LSDEAQAVSEFAKGVLESVSKESGEWPLLEEQVKKQENQAGLIAVLCRTGAEVARLAESMRLNSIRFEIARNRSFFELPEIEGLINLIRTLADTKDAISEVGFYRSWFGGLSDRELLDTGPDGRRAQARKFLDSISPLSGSLSVSEIISRALSTLQIEQVFETAATKSESANIFCFLEFVSAAERAREFDSSSEGFLRWLEVNKNSSRFSLGVSQGQEPVVLSTIHAAKGLEYPMVVLPFLGERKRAEEDIVRGDYAGTQLLSMRIEDPEGDYARKKTLLARLLEQQRELQYAGEERRVFYVACTRPRDYLQLFTRPLKNEAPDFKIAAKSSSASEWMAFSQNKAAKKEAKSPQNLTS